MKIAIVQFPGSNCERETILAVKRAGMDPVEFLWNEPAQNLIECAGYIIVGGFSYEDRSRSGAIAALDPIMQVIKEQSRLGKPVLGLCNGAQILVETGLVPGLDNDDIGMALTVNKRMQQGKVVGTGFYNAWVNIRLSDEYQLNAFTRTLTPGNILHIPVAHGEGRFMIPPVLLSEIQSHGLNVFQYCDLEGHIVDELPVNPNGSIDNIAAISNKSGNVLAMMPHPERTPNGDAIFQSMREYITEGYVKAGAPLCYYPRPADIIPYHTKNHELVVELIIKDNQAISVETALNQIGIPVKIARQTHWEIECDSMEILEKIKTSGVLYNERKEFLVQTSPRSSFLKKRTHFSLLTRQKDDILGKQKKQMLEDHFAIHGISMIRQSVLWHIMTEDEENIYSVLQSHILYNPYGYDCYEYE